MAKIGSEHASSISDNKDIELDSLVNSMETMLGCLHSKYVQDSLVNSTGTMLGCLHSKYVQDSLVNSMETMLGCLHSKYVQACSISFVPEQLGKSKPEAYMPRKVSIGPLHRGACPDLIFMEDIKWRWMERLLSRIKKEVKNERLKVCSRAIFELDEILRSNYNVDDIKFNNHGLSKIMLLDGCFLLELLIGEFQGKNDIPERGLVLSDLTVLGNQIPFIILSKLATILFSENVEKEITKRVLYLLGYPSEDWTNLNSFRPVHVLGLVHSFITLETREVYEINHVPIDVDSHKIDDEKQLKLKRCATKLEAAGGTIKPTNRNWTRFEEMIRFDLRVIFSNGILEIPPLHITETTEAKWRNFIAWELTQSPYSKFNIDSQKDGISSPEKKDEILGCKFIWYAQFFQGLICSVHDIQLLIERKVIVVHDAESSSRDSKGGKKKKIMSNEDLLAFFRNITKEVREDQIVQDYQFYKLFQDLNSYSPPTTPLHWVTVKSRILWHSWRRVLTAIWCFFRDSYKMLKRQYIITRWDLILAVASTLTFVLVVLTAVSTFFPNLVSKSHSPAASFFSSY